jgi:hypothetical protein
VQTRVAPRRRGRAPERARARGAVRRRTCARRAHDPRSMHHTPRDAPPRHMGLPHSLPGPRRHITRWSVDVRRSRAHAKARRRTRGVNARVGFAAKRAPPAHRACLFKTPCTLRVRALSPPPTIGAASRAPLSCREPCCLSPPPPPHNLAEAY